MRATTAASSTAGCPINALSTSAGLNQRPFSEATAALVDAEVKAIVEECQDEAQRLLGENRARLDALARALLKEESLDEEEVLRVTGLPGQDSASGARLAAAR